MGTVLVGIVGILVFLGVLSFPQFNPTNNSPLENTSHLISLIHFMSFVTSFTVQVGKVISFTAATVYNIIGWWGHHVLLHWKMSLSKHCLGLITILGLRPRLGLEK